jgi:signal transduction histidine kinase/DNA-binding NarL/FixJ family response regulator
MPNMQTLGTNEYSSFISILIQNDDSTTKIKNFCEYLERIWHDSVVLYFAKVQNKTLENLPSKCFKNVYSSNNNLLFEKSFEASITKECQFEPLPHDISRSIFINVDTTFQKQFWIGKREIGFFIIQLHDPSIVCEDIMKSYESIFSLFFCQMEHIVQTTKTESESMFSDQFITKEIVEKTPNIVCSFTEDGTIVFFNEIASKTLFGISKQEFLSNFSVSEFIINQPQWVLSIIEDVAIPTVKEQGIWSGNTAILNYFEIEVPMFQTLMGHFDLEGRLLYISTILKDTTETKLQEEVLLTTVEEAQAANRAKSEFLANMSHEIRTPMNAILGFTEILRKEITDSRHKHFLDSIQLSGKTLLRLINDILDLSKIEAGKLEIQQEHIDLSVLASEIRLVFAEQMNTKQLEYTVEYMAQEQLFVFIDDVRLRQILINLIGNAIKFTSKGYVKVFIRVSKNSDSEKNATVTVEVHDSGIGIPESKQKDIFEPFTQQDGQTTRKYGGTGLGLTITRKLVELMDGKISLISTPDHGSMFKIVFLNVKIGTNQQVNEQNQQNVYRTIQFNDPTVMIVDDMMSNREVIKEYLSDCNVSIVECEDGTEALAFTLVEKPDLIFMVLRMAELDGFETTKILKSHENTRPIPVIAITSALMDTEEQQFMELADGSLRKPVSRNEVLNEMTKFLPFSEITEQQHAVTKEFVQEGDDVDIIPLELLQQLQTYESTSEELLEIISLDEIETFAQVLLSLGDMYSFRPLLNYANDLTDAVGTIDYSQLQKLLGQYKDLLTNYNG